MADDKDERVSSPAAPENAAEETTAKNDASEEQVDETAGGADASVNEDAAPAESEDKASGENKDNAGEAKVNGDTTPTQTTNDANGSASASNKKNSKRKSTGAVPEHKVKKLNKKKSMPNLHLDVEAGDYWFVQMKGYPPWPAIIVEDDMLPATLLENRPVSAKQANGEYRADFLEGGKNAKDRRYPVMFLGTNEFAWHVNTELSPLDMSEIKELVKKDDRGKKGKAIWEAYQVAAKEHDLDHFRQMLLDHQDQLRQFEEEQDAKDAEKARKDAEKAEKAAKAEKMSSKKSKNKPKEVAADDDVEMEDAEDGAVKAPKSASKKRKKEAAEGDDEPEKPAKTPKTIKLTGLKDKEKADEPSAKKTKTPKSTTKKTPKPKEKAKESGEDADLTEDQKKEKSMGKMVLYLRHKLQKGFLARDQKPKEEEMEAMDQQFKQLEGLTDLDAATIRSTKINKVLKAILKLQEIPKEAELKFKERSSAMLSKWAPMLGIDDSLKTDEPAATNGDKHDDEEEPAAEAKSSDEKMEDVKPTGDDEKEEVKGEAEKETAEAAAEAPKTEVSAEA